MFSHMLTWSGEVYQIIATTQTTDKGVHCSDSVALTSHAHMQDMDIKENSSSTANAPGLPLKPSVMSNTDTAKLPDAPKDQAASGSNKGVSGSPSDAAIGGTVNKTTADASKPVQVQKATGDLLSSLL